MNCGHSSAESITVFHTGEGDCVACKVEMLEKISRPPLDHATLLKLSRQWTIGRGEMGSQYDWDLNNDIHLRWPPKENEDLAKKFADMKAYAEFLELRLK